MIDIRELRRDTEGFLAKLARKGAADIGQELIQVDAAWRAATASVETLRAEQKQQSGRPSVSELQQLARRKEDLQKAQAELTALERRRKDLLDRVPNPPADDVPDGGEKDFEHPLPPRRPARVRAHSQRNSHYRSRDVGNPRELSECRRVDRCPEGTLEIRCSPQTRRGTSPADKVLEIGLPGPQYRSRSVTPAGWSGGCPARRRRVRAENIGPRAATVGANA